MQNRRLFIATLVIGGALILSLSLNAYFLRSEPAGWALWNAKEAYFFVGRDTAGYHVKWLGLPLMMLGQMLGRIEPPDDDRSVMYVVRVTSASVERHVLELPYTGPQWFTPLEGRIWANWPAVGGLCYWAGDHFEPATPDERQRLDGISRLRNNAYRDDDGWSKDGLSAGDSPEIRVGDEFELHVVSGGTSGHSALSVEMSKQGSEPTTVFSFEGRTGRVSRSEYWHAFHDPE